MAEMPGRNETMGKKVEHEVRVEIRDGRLYGKIIIQHSSLKHSTETTGLAGKWTCHFDGEALQDVLADEAGKNISVRMANIRELPYEEFVEKRRKLFANATVNYKDISDWTTKGQRGRVRFEDMSADEIMAKMTPAQLEAMRRKFGL